MDYFTKIPNEILEALLMHKFTKRQLKILLLICRLTYGCSKSFAILKKADLKVVGIYKVDSGWELEKLKNQKVILCESSPNLIYINREINEWQVSKILTNGDEGVSKLLTNQLVKYQQLVGKILTPKVEKPLYSAEPKESIKENKESVEYDSIKTGERLESMRQFLRDKGIIKKFDK